MPPQEYRISSADTPADLGLQVTDLLSQGWNLYGHPFAAGRSDRRCYYQALVRTPVSRNGTAAPVAWKKTAAAEPVRVRARPARPRVAASLRHVAAFVAVTFGGYLLAETLIFRSGWYARFLDPEYSAAGSLERAVYDETNRAPSGRKEILVVGNSRLAEGFSARIANEYKPEYGYTFVNLGVPATGCRVWYYLLRDLDPGRNRYAAITIPIDDYDDFDDYEDVADRTTEVSIVINRLGLGDILPYTLSFPSWKSRYEVFRRLAIKGLEYQRDFQAFFEHPGERLQRAAEFRRHGAQWAYGYSGVDRSLAGMQVDWEHERITFPAGIPPDFQHHVASRFFHHTPQLGRNRAFEVGWIGAILNRYRDSRTRFIIYQVPRGPAPSPKPLARLPWTSTDELKKHRNTVIVDRHAFESLERPEFFADHVHLNAAGRRLFSPMLVDVVRQSLQ